MLFNMNSCQNFLAVIFFLCILQAVSTNQFISVVLVGATGDLAKKYLWHSMFETYKNGIENKGPYFLFFGGARANKTFGEDTLMKIIDRSVTCYNMQCESHKRRFITVVRYVQLKVEEDYENLAHQMALDEEGHSPDNPIAGRIFYLSTPPATYVKTAQLLHKHCRSHVANSWIRLVLEKPFGNDRKTSEALASSLEQWYSEEEIYRVDHYLQKPVVKQILPFRIKNQNWLEPLLNRHHVERVEIVSKEYVGVKGRTKFYNNVGVLRDMMQNHLTELLTLVSMELPTDGNVDNIDEIKEKKIALLEQVQPMKVKSLLFGQYKDYMQEAEKEGINKSSSVKTPTFAAALLRIESARWKDVPFVLVAGKQMDERTTYVRIIFKNNVFKIPPTTDNERIQQIVFHINYGVMKEPCIIVPWSLHKALWPKDVVPKMWSQPPAYGSEMSTFQTGVPGQTTDAYIQVVQDIVNGKQANFVGTRQLMSMWDIWQTSLNVLAKRPKLYTRNNTLDFTIINKQLAFVESEHLQQEYVKPTSDKPVFAQLPKHFLGGNLYVNSTGALAMQLTSSIIEISMKLIKEKKPFHIGFSGGKTPALLFRKLREIYPLHLWVNTHIWLVDERCQPLNSHRSNFNLLFTELLQHINIPYVNLHPMPVSIAGSLCTDKDEGDILYERQLSNAVINGLDYVVLGLGKDGHVASLFPHDKSLTLTTPRKVILTNAANRGDKRMSLTVDFLNMSKNIALFVTGKEKHNILNSISSESDRLKYPVQNIQPNAGHLAWFVDSAAWLGV
ncbi:GDH/6PGL endoplasmic bifunctional protein [Octopus vulgaris]|uniref:GDH/6PGL endoplasmic bifunctional protein n=1 Tax=Octopus vulgaris TaxID=6645 RepID=A0AA36F3F2_OCTVU|nr:GDH/6PGL endoplasmic bifunctional protein [Octopus vulgaris]